MNIKSQILTLNRNPQLPEWFDERLDALIQHGQIVTDFDGQSIRASEFASRYGAYGTPTLLFLTPDGTPFSEAKFGVPDAIDFFAYDIEETIKRFGN